MFYHSYLWVIFVFLDDLYWIVIFISVSNQISWIFEDEYFPAKTRTESCPNPYEISLPFVLLSSLWMSCHFSFSRDFSFWNQIFMNFMVYIVFLLLWKQEQNPFPLITHVLASIVRSTHTWNKLVDLIQKTFLLSNVSLLQLSLSH